VQAPTLNHAAARTIIDGQTAGGGTATGDALQLALEFLHGKRTAHPVSAIVLLSDGAANAGINVITVARQAAAEKIPIYTVALGTPNGTLPNPEPFAPPIGVPPDPQLMQQIARASHGRSFDARSADQLASIYRHLGTRLGTATRKRDVTAGFAIGALALLLLAAATSSRWSARLP
jgi:Ca-activated chloride channel family protein